MRCWLFISGLCFAIIQGQTLPQPSPTPAAPTWISQTSGTTANLRGLNVVSDKIAWASGSQGTILRTIDGGATWSKVGPPGVADLDFRDVEAFNDREAIAMSAGEGRQSRLYSTSDGGGTWTTLKINVDSEGFWDAISFWDPQHGILMGDPVKGRFTILTTDDGGLTWKPRQGPKAEKSEAAFAASGTALTVRGGHEAWFVTGGPGGGRVLHSIDGGDTWDAYRTPVKPTEKSAGLYSLAFAPDGKHGVAVGGDYTKPKEPVGNALVTRDGGKNWTAAEGLTGYHSAIFILQASNDDASIWMTVGPNGTACSHDPEGSKFSVVDDAPFNAAAGARFNLAWAVGPNGAIGRLRSDALAERCKSSPLKR